MIKALAVAAVVFVTGLMTGGSGLAAEGGNTVVLELRTGKVIIEMLPDLAPKHVERIKTLVKNGFYDGLKFHRVIDGFMAQTGDPRGDGTGGSGQNIEAEFTATPFERGVVGMARSQSVDSADSQFFIMFAPAPSLNNKYTVWGRVTGGMEHVDRIKKGEAALNGVVQDPDTIVRMYMMDAP